KLSFYNDKVNNTSGEEVSINSYGEIWLFIPSYITFVSAIYRFALDEEHKRFFENVALQTNRYTTMIPVAFLLGFYVTLVVQRWWDQFELFAWIDSLSFLVSIYIIGDGLEERLIRKTILRYVNLGATMTLIEKSPLIAKRFPTLNHLIDFGLLTVDEMKIIEAVQSDPPHPKYAIPYIWAGKVVDKALVKGKVRDTFTARALIEEIGKLRAKCGTVLTYDVIDIPLVYTQVVTLAVYCYFASSLLSRQFLDPKMNYDDYKVDLYVPIITYLQFFFYMGWLKVSNMLADDGCREWPSCVHDTNNGLKDPVVLNQLYKKEPATMFANIIMEKLDVTSLDR
ncbi:Bestrophin-4, partial [Armadillidium nasatum]